VDPKREGKGFGGRKVNPSLGKGKNKRGGEPNIESASSRRSVGSWKPKKKGRGLSKLLRNGKRKGN